MAIPHVVQINISPGGIPKTPIDRGEVTFSRIIGDDWNDKKHHGARDQALLLVSLEMIEALIAEGFPLFPGALGENITTGGLDFRTLRPGQVLRIGSRATVRLSRVRIPCRTITVYGEGIIRATYDDEVKRGNAASPRWGRSGFYAEVLQEGSITPGDPIVRLKKGPQETFSIDWSML